MAAAFYKITAIVSSYISLMSTETPSPVQETQRSQAEDFLKLCAELEVEDIPVTFSHREATVILPAILMKFTILSVLFRLDKPNKWQAALENGWIPEALLNWLGVRDLEALSKGIEIGWIAPKLFVDILTERVCVLLIEMRQPYPGAFVRQTIRRLFLHKGSVREGGLTMASLYWKRFLRNAAKAVRSGIGQEVHQRIRFALGQMELAEVAPRRWLPVPELSEENSEILRAAKVQSPSEKLQALGEAFAAGLFDFIADLLATSYSVYGRRAYHPVLMWKVIAAMMAVKEMEPEKFLERVNDSIQLRVFLGVMSKEELPSARRIKGFLLERVAPVAEQLVLWFNVELVSNGGMEMGEEFGTDGIEMNAQARTRSDAVREHLKPHLEWLIVEIREYLESEGRTELTDVEVAALMEALRDLDWSNMGSAKRNKHAILEAVRTGLGVQVVTPHSHGPPGQGTCSGLAPPAFQALAAAIAKEFSERIKAFPSNFNWDTLYDRECGAKSKYGKTTYGFGMQFVIDLAYGLVWAFAVFPVGESFQPHIAEFMLTFKKLHGLGEIKLTSDREFTIALAIHKWHKDHILHYGPRSANHGKSKGIFTAADFVIHEDYAVCPNQKLLNRKPNMSVRGTNHEWRYQAKKTDCEVCPIREKCTTGKGPRILGVNVYREDMARHAARMEADPETTRDLMARHRALVEGTVNNLKNHQGAKRSLWKGLAMARVQFALAIVMLNLLKWHKVSHDLLENLKLKRATEAAAA